MAEGEIAKEEVFVTDYTGTALGIHFKTNERGDFKTLLDEIRIKGELLAAQTEGAIRSASKSTSGRCHLKL